MDMVKQFNQVNHVNGIKSPIEKKPESKSLLQTDNDGIDVKVKPEQKVDATEKMEESDGKNHVDSEGSSSETTTDNSQSKSELADADGTADKVDNGGTLTFFQEGKPLLELFHKHEKSSWYQVKSKTYWPPSTTAKTTTISQDHFRTDNTIHQSPDDFSSSNSSPWSHEHVRKQSVPQKLSKDLDCFMYSASTSSKRFLKRKRLKRFSSRLYNLTTDLMDRTTFKRKPTSLVSAIKSLCDRLGVSYETNVSIASLLDKFNKEMGAAEHSLFSPRKRYLRHWDYENDTLSRKKSHVPPKDMQSSSSSCFVPVTSAMNSHSSSYSIDSLLSQESNPQDESFLRSILKTEKSRKASPMKPSKNHSTKNDRYPFPYHKDSFNDRHKILDKNDIGTYLNSTGGLSGFYLNSFLGRSWGHPSGLPQSTHPESLAAAAAVAAVNSHINPIMNAPSLLPSPHPLLGMSPYLPPSSINHLLSTNHSLPPLNHPISPVPSCVPQAPSPHMSNSGSPRPPLWPSPSPNRSSPYKDNSPLVSPPPQDVPLNLSKPKEKG